MRRSVLLLVSVMVSCGGGERGSTGVSSDALDNFCTRRCEHQATCVPELRDIIGECRRQCRTSFDNDELFTSNCQEPSLIARGDPVGPYTLASVVQYQECLITLSCKAEENPCPETRMFCLDGLSAQERCWRSSRVGYDRCSSEYTTCIQEMRTDCDADVQRCYTQVQQNDQRCQQ